MKSFLKIVGSIFLLAAALVFLLSFVDRNHFNDHADDYKGAYNITALSSSVELEAPVLPDISQYSAKEIRANVPVVTGGTILVEELGEAIPKLKSDADIFGDMQGRFDALAITIIDGVYDLSRLVKEINDSTIIEKTEKGAVILHVPLSIEAEGHLLIRKDEKLFLSANTGALIYNFGKLTIVDALIYGWNAENQEPAYYEDRDLFRPYFATWCGGRTDIAGSTIGHLGYQKSKSYGITYTSCSDSLYSDDYAYLPGGTGYLIDNKFTDIYFGFYSYDAHNIAIIGNEYIDNIVYGIDPHDRSKNLIIAHNTVRGTKEKHGIITSRDVHESYIFKNVTEGNNGSGIMLDRNSHDNVVAYNISRDNGGDGLTFYESSNNTSYKNKLIGNKSSGFRVRNSWDIISYEEVINDNKTAVRLYSSDLSDNKKTKHRDIELDPYVQKLSISMIRPEMIGNQSSNFQMSDIDSLEIHKPVFFKSPHRIFSGDLKTGSKAVFSELQASEGLLIEKKN